MPVSWLRRWLDRFPRGEDRLCEVVLFQMTTFFAFHELSYLL